MRRILLTGFEPFNNLSTNPSQEIIFAIESEKIDGITTRILPVEFGKSSEILIGLIEKFRPDFVICLGQAEGRNQITPERIAVNLESGDSY